MRIIVVDDHILFREGLANILQAEADIEIAGMAGSVRESVEMARTLRPDLILMDFGLPDGSGAEATRRILHEHSECKIVFLTMSEEEDDLFAAIRSGAKGYLIKNMRPSKLVAALRAVHQGESAISREMTLRLMEELARTKAPEPSASPAFASLTPRETEVLGEIAMGKSNLEIAEQLFLSENTVKYHVHSILDKLDLKDRKAAAKYAREHGLIQ